MSLKSRFTGVAFGLVRERTLSLLAVTRPHCASRERENRLAAAGFSAAADSAMYRDPLIYLGRRRVQGLRLSSYFPAEDTRRRRGRTDESREPATIERTRLNLEIAMEDYTPDFSVAVQGVKGFCPAGEGYAKRNISEGKIPVLSCEGPCIRGEIARLAQGTRR